ncbi:MAG: TauD/TfdA family dioxygenase [Gammaproteobacteria bacterium]|nr:TauD/TfdA family dioxygenase [Gammaproteobacteria bacterium]MCP5298557.1 TauD/TfdA family dioxygenase [Chromatiaceae bacterium]
MPEPAIVRPGGPFDLDDATAYQAWRRLKNAAGCAPKPVEIQDLTHLDDSERARILDECAVRNFALFRVRGVASDDEAALQSFGRRLGLLDIDQNLCAEDSGVTAITVKPTATDNVYIPYTSRPLGWHTDGYYNAGLAQVRAWLLYCVQPAAEGGANELLDHEIAYIRVRDENPGWIRALMAPDAFTIPSNTEGGQQIRPDHSGPVFSVSPVDGSLHMRYSARQRNVIWKDDPDTLAASAFLLDLFQRGDDRMFRYRLAAGEGLISNNVLHRRDGFRDAPEQGLKRLIYRARYYQRLPRPEE